MTQKRIAFIALIIAGFACIAAYLALPQTQRWLFPQPTATQGPGLLGLVIATSVPPPTYTPYPTQTLYPTSVIPTPLPVTLTPIGMTNQVVQVNGKTALGQPFQTGIYIQAGDIVQINYVSGQWYIGQNINGDWTSQSPTDANGYTGREGDRVASLLIDAIRTNPNACRPLLSAPFGSLIGRIGDTGGLFYIGNSYEFTAQDSGVLYLLINYWDHNHVIDCPYGDGGEISVRVNITPH
jgi:hypothetical protein